MRNRAAILIAMIAIGAIVLAAGAAKAAQWEPETQAVEREQTRERRTESTTERESVRSSRESLGVEPGAPPTAPGRPALADPRGAGRVTERAAPGVVVEERERREVIIEQPQATIEVEPESVVVEPRRRIAPPPYFPDIGFVVDIWTDRAVYQIDDRVTLYFRVTKPAYVYIYNTDSRGETRQIFPNFFDRDNYCVPGRRYVIPDENYRLRVDGPPGHESFRIVAVRDRPVWYERGMRYSEGTPFPVYEPGARGFIQEHKRRSSRAESIVAEPKYPKPGAVVVEKERVVIEPPFDREYAESYTTVQVVGSFRREVPVFFGTLEIDSSPQRARVYVDHIFRGYTPLILSYMDPGSHFVELERIGASWRGTVNVRSGRTTLVDVRLGESKRDRGTIVVPR